MIPIPERLSRMAPPWAWLTLATLVLILAGFGFYARHQKDVAAAYRSQAAQAQVQEAQAVQVAQDARSQALKITAERDQATREVRRLGQALAAAQRPPAPAPAPAGDAELTKGLETAGLKIGLVLFRGNGPSTLEHQDAVRVWDWNAQALRVPALELRLGAAEDLVNGQAKESEALKGEVLAWTTSSDRWQAAHGASALREEALQGEVKALHKAATADKWKTAGELFLALLAGYVLRGL